LSSPGVVRLGVAGLGARLGQARVRALDLQPVILVFEFSQ
jgi:hypothetical protein